MYGNAIPPAITAAPATNNCHDEIRLLALLVKKLQIFVKKILIEKYNFN
ncbi:hypothetical protein [Spiroplasma poulsonii]|nr:hypothetical protein [Spiroplasma poulsonii]